MKKTALLLSLAFASTSFASLLNNQLGSNQLQGVTLATAATMTSDAGSASASTKLTMAGAGLRKKKVLAVKANVYVAQLFLSSPESFVHSADAALKTAALSNVVAMQLTFLRDVEAAKVQAAFAESFQANNIDQQAADVKTFLADVAAGGDAQSKKNMTILVAKNQDGSEVLQYEDTAGKVSTVKGSAGLGQKILSIWLGAMTDAELDDCKTQIIGQ